MKLRELGSHTDVLKADSELAAVEVEVSPLLLRVPEPLTCLEFGASSHPRLN